MTLQRLLTILLLVVSATLSLYARAQDKQPEYRLGSGDTIRVTVFQNPDLTLETRVTEDGTISYPLIGSARIGGMTIAAAERTIANALRNGGFIKQPQVNIFVLLNRANQVSVLGQVNRPGRFPLETFTTTVSEMVAIAGGITPAGADTVILTGTRNGEAFRREIDIASIFLSKNSQQDPVVAGGDTIYVPRAPMFYIYGEVQRPGTYRIERGMTIRQALATAGGPTVRGTERNLMVHRRTPDGAIEEIPANPNDLVGPDQVLYVRESLF